MKNPDRKIEIMGIVNLTDDSYYAPSRCGTSDAVSVALERIRALIAEGADIIELVRSGRRRNTGGWSLCWKPWRGNSLLRRCR